MSELARTALYGLHEANGARFVPFAGYEMAVQYNAGVIAEHQHTRASASLFDVSHMGIVDLDGPGVDEALEQLVPSSVVGIAEGRQRYTVLTNETGGIIDDLIITRRGPEELTAVVNGALKSTDIEHLRASLPETITVEHRDDRSLLALQGPAAVDVLAAHTPALADLVFMDSIETEIAGISCTASRSGYTGEDGFELAVANEQAVELASTLLADARVELAGLGGRDTLRLEAGLCLSGSDIDETTTPVEADLSWIIQKRRRVEGGFLGAEVILEELASGPQRKRVGISAAGKRPIRDGAELYEGDRVVGIITSGGYGPTVGGPVAMGYLDTTAATSDTVLTAHQRGKTQGCTVAPLPFVAHRYVR